MVKPSVVVFTSLLLAVAPARGDGARHHRVPLLDCSPLLAKESGGTSFAAPLIARFAAMYLRELGGFRGLEIRRSGGRPSRVIDLPDLTHSARRWRIDAFAAGGRTYYVYDVGPRNLELDQQVLDAILLSYLRDDVAGDGALLRSSEQRRANLRYLARYQRAFASRMSPDASDPPDTATFANADLFGVLDRHLKPSANTGRIADHLVMAARLTHDQPRNFVRPGLDGLRRELGLPEPARAPLPHLRRLDERRAASVQADFLAEFGRGPHCELSHLDHFRNNLPDGLRLRLLGDALAKARSRKCQTIVTSSPARFRFVELFGFHPWRSVRLADGRREQLYTLDVNSLDFNAALVRIHGQLRELAE